MGRFHIKKVNVLVVYLNRRISYVSIFPVVKYVSVTSSSRLFCAFSVLAKLHLFSG